MVNLGEKSLEEVIVQVFEEQEDLFYFPVTSQKQARSFIKALHGKGIQYEEICEEIGEFEHNFSAWRKGLGRAGIGNRIIELINKPFQEILLSDSEESDDGGANGDSLNGRLHNVAKKSQSNGDEVTRPSVEERLPLHQDREAQKEKQVEITDSWMKKIEEKTAVANDNMKTESVSEEASGTRDIPKKQEPKEEGFTLETVKLRRVTRKPAENPVVMREKKEGQFERTLSFREKLEKARQRESKTLSNAAPRVESSDSSDGSDRSSKSSESSQETQDNEDSQNKENEVNEEKDKVTEKTHNRLDIEKAEATKEKSEESKTQDDVDKIDGKGDQDKKHDGNEATHSNEKVDLLKDQTSSDEEVDGKDADTVSSSDSSESQEDECEHTQVGESYDSDFDPDSQDNATELGALLKRLSSLKSQSLDGPGFIYIFSDQNQSSMHRVKLGASRFPNKRLEQAKQFNIDLRLVSAVAVSCRQKALGEIFSQIDQHKISGHNGWFTISLDTVISTVSQIALKYPSESSDC